MSTVAKKKFYLQHWCRPLILKIWQLTAEDYASGRFLIWLEKSNSNHISFAFPPPAVVLTKTEIVFLAHFQLTRVRTRDPTMVVFNHSRNSLGEAGEVRSIEPIDIPFLQDPGTSTAAQQRLGYWCE